MFMQHFVVLLLLLLLLLYMPTVAVAINGGESMIQTFYGWKPIEIISQGDSRAAADVVMGDEYHLPGVFDGAGAYLVEHEEEDVYDEGNDHNQTSIIRIHVNHEMIPASISEVNVDKQRLMEAIDSMQFGGDIGQSDNFVIDARLAYTRWTDDGGQNWHYDVQPESTMFCKFCSSQEYSPNTFGPNRGFVDQLYVTGEECSNGRLFVLDSNNRDLYQLSNVTGSSILERSMVVNETSDDDDVESTDDRGGIPFNPFENAALIDTNETNYIALLLSPDRHGDNETLKLYIGHKGKNSTGDESSDLLSRNGLAYGQWYYLRADFPDSIGDASHGMLAKNSTGGLAGMKLEDVDTSPSQPNKVVLAESRIGVFVLEFDFAFPDVEQSTFIVKKLNSNGIKGQDNVDWTGATETNPEGLIYINEDSGRGAIWRMSPSDDHKIAIGRTKTSAESSGIFDLSVLVNHEPGTIMVTSNQGNPASLTLLINPTALPLGTPLYEAESARLTDCTVSTRHPWYHGSAYADFGGLGSFVEWTIDGDQIAGGKYKIVIAYASGDNDRQCDVVVDDELVGEFHFYGSNWGIWKLEVLPNVIELVSDQAHKITLRAQNNKGPNVDFLAIIPQESEMQRSIAIPSWTAPDGSTVYEAEFAAMVRARVEDENLGFDGIGYIDFRGAYASLEWLVDIPFSNSVYELTFRYATSEARPTQLLIDGRAQSNLLEFPSTSDWENWEVLTTLVHLTIGTHSIKVSTWDVSEGPNIDWMSIKLVDDNDESNTSWMSGWGDNGQRSMRGVFYRESSP